MNHLASPSPSSSSYQLMLWILSLMGPPGDDPGRRGGGERRVSSCVLPAVDSIDGSGLGAGEFPALRSVPGLTDWGPKRRRRTRRRRGAKPEHAQLQGLYVYSNSKPTYIAKPRSPHPTPSTVSGSGSAPGHLRLRSYRRVRPRRYGTHSRPRFAQGRLRQGIRISNIVDRYPPLCYIISLPPEGSD